MTGNTSSTSVHFAADDKEVIQGLPLNRNAWHTGDVQTVLGRKSIGVEICYSKSGGAKYYAAEKLAIKFVAQLLKERNWGVIVSANIKTGTASIVRTVFCQRGDGTRLRLPSKQN